MSTNRSKPSALAARVAAERRQRAIMAMLRDEQTELTEQLDGRFRELSDRGMVAARQDAERQPTTVENDKSDEGDCSSLNYDKLYYDLQLLPPIRSATSPLRGPQNVAESLPLPNKSYETLSFGVALNDFLECASSPGASSKVNIAKLDSLLHNCLRPLLKKCPIAGPRHISDQLNELHSNFFHSKSCRIASPLFLQVSFLRLIVQLFSSDARFHPILSPAFAFASALVAHTRVCSIGQCARLIFLSGQMCEWFCVWRPRYFPEVMAFLLGALQLCCESQIDRPGCEEPFPTMNFPISLPHRQMLFVAADNRRINERTVLGPLSLERIFHNEIGGEDNSEESVNEQHDLQLCTIRALLHTIGQYAHQYGSDQASAAMRTAFNSIFGPFHCLCLRLPLANYPTELAQEALQLLRLLTKLLEQNSRLTQMKRISERGLREINMLQPRFEEKFDPERQCQHRNSKGPKEREKSWARQANKERRGALKGLRKDARAKANDYTRRQRKVRQERDEKTKRILQSLETQESEHKKLKALKH